MKLRMTLPEQPGFLHALPLFDLFALLLLFFLLGPALVLQSGVAVELPPSKFQMERFEETLVITLAPGKPRPRIHLGRTPVSFESLGSQLDELREAGHASKAVVLLQSDSSIPVGEERAITEMILDKGFRVALVGSIRIDELANPD
jgi:biopolymer transport protein ExbD